MTVPQKHLKELCKICTSLREALSAEPEECRRLVAQTLKRAESLSESIVATPAKLGQMGGLVTAKRGSDYFRELASKRKVHAGGRPKADKAEH